MIQEVKFRGHVISEVDDEFETVKFHLKVPDGIPKDSWNDVLVAQMHQLARRLHSENRICRIYDHKKGKFVVADPT